MPATISPWIGVLAASKPALLDYIAAFGVTWLNTDVFLLIQAPCGEIVQYATADDVPDNSVPCSCGQPEHWFIKYDEVKA